MLTTSRCPGVFSLTPAHGIDRLLSAHSVLRRIAPDDLPFFARIHALPELAQHLDLGGRPRSPEESAAWWSTFSRGYEQRLALPLAEVSLWPSRC